MGKKKQKTQQEKAKEFLEHKKQGQKVEPDMNYQKKHLVIAGLTFAFAFYGLATVVGQIIGAFM